MKNFIILIIFTLYSSLAFAQIELPAGTNTNTYSNASDGEIYKDENNQYYIGLSDGKLMSIGDGQPQTSDWTHTGNANTTNNSFLGTSNDRKMTLKSNNISVLEFGRRQTLGLVQNIPDYSNNNQYLTHLLGQGGISALQFQANGADLYKPMFFSSTNGSFRLKGSAGRTDLFEIGSAGPDNGGRLEFIVGDDGDEPIIFKRYDHRNSKSYRELFRVQGHANSADAKTRFGININTGKISLDPNFSHNYNGTIPAGTQNAITLRKPNSTLEVGGSFATAITETTGTITLSEDHHTVIIGGNHTINLPTGSTLKGRIYIIKNPNSFATVVNSYKGMNGTTTINTINPNTVLWVQHDGSDWQQISGGSNPNGIDNNSGDIKHAEYSFTGTINVNTSTLTFKNFFATEISNDGAVSRPSSNEIEIEETGLYIISFNSALILGNNINYVGSKFILYKNGSVLTNASMEAQNAWVRGRGNSNDETSIHFTTTLKLNDNDKLRIATIRENTVESGSLNAQGNRTSLTITKLKSL
ncbi:MAG: hypothetical protein N4A45_09725 [Flavobacteriales bacterium]|jgi:hypothetical protein|nr:hypothetical protein [Flavobacteriales bacterium]